MKDLIIVGASGFGREVLQWAKDVNKITPVWNIRGFIDDNLNALDGYKCDYKVLGRIHDWELSDNEVYTCAIAIPSTKEKLVTLLRSKGAVSRV